MSCIKNRMSYIKSRKHAVARALQPLGTILALSLPAYAQADGETATLKEVLVEDSVAAGYKAGRSSSPKFTAPLLDTPKTVQVIGAEVMEQRGATTLQEALTYVPGITFGNGEGGNPTGDQPFIRGSDAQSSTFVDGMRDIAAGSREAFNIESVEVIKGADSVYAGRGGAGGSINIVTKRAMNENFVRADAGLGTDRYKRATLDFNRVVSDGTGLRLNAMAHDADVAGRDGPADKRWGIAPTVTFGLDTPTEISLSWQHLQTDNRPDGGVPWLYSNAAAAGLPGGSTVRPTYGDNRANWYGLRSRDFEREKSDMLTAAIEHKLSAHGKFRNSLRYSRSGQNYVWTQPDDSQGNVAGGYVYRRGNARAADVRTLQNFSEFTGKVQTGPVEHTFATGLELAREKSDSRTASLTASSTLCTAVSLWCASLDHPDGSAAWTGSYDLSATQPAANQIDTIALYGFDTLKLSERWLLNAGLRLDHYRIDASGPAGKNNPAYDTARTDTLLNYQLGVVYKPTTNGSLYASFSTASRPGGSALGNGNEDLTVATGETAALKPEKTRAIELGTKWDLLDKRLSVSAALFRNQVTNARITENGITYMGGNKAVNGVELGFAGSLMPRLSVFGGYTYMHSQQKNLGADNAGNGLPYPNTPRHSLSLWTSYKPAAQWTLGLGVNASSSVNQGYIRSVADGGIVTKAVPGYARIDAMAAYQFTTHAHLQINVYNLTDKPYYSGVRSPHYATLAPGRSVVVALKLNY